MKKTMLLTGLILLLGLSFGCMPMKRIPTATPETGAPSPPEDYRYIDGALQGIQSNGQTILVISTPGGKIKRFQITENTRFEIDGTTCGVDILLGHEGWELSVYYWEGKEEAESVIIRSHPGWVWEATLIVEAGIIPGPPEAPEKGSLKVKVTDSLLNRPVAEAAITVNRPETTPAPETPQHGPLILGNTNEAGELVRELNPSWQGRYIIRARKGGFNPGETEIDFSVPLPASQPRPLPALVMPQGKPVVVSQDEIESSPDIEMVDILISINGEALFILLADDAKLDAVTFRSTLARYIGCEVETVSQEPFLRLKVRGMPTRDKLATALDKVGEELRWYTGRAVGWGNYW